MNARSFHPLADLFPLFDGVERERLVADIAKNGLQEPIVLFENKILDGRNRYIACFAAGVPRQYRVYEGTDPLAYVVSMNLHRRHLSESQRAMVTAKLTTLPSGSNQYSEGLPIGRASELLNVGERSVARARAVRKGGVSELREAVEKGNVSVSAAANIASLPDDEQLIAIAGGEKAILRISKTIRDDRSAKRRGERIAKIAAIAKGNTALSTDTRYPVIYADPPWEYDFQPSEDRSSENHYPSMSLADICDLPVSDLATPDAMLYLWATAPKLEEALAVVKAWGFDYRTSFVWAKDKIGMGRYCRNQHEYLLVCRRGDIPTPPVKARFSSLVHAPRLGHSEKPERFYEIIEAAYPELPKIELFCRRPRDGWSVWGNQAETA